MNLSKEFIEANKKANSDKEYYALIDQRSIEYSIFLKENFAIIKRDMLRSGIKINKANVVHYISSRYNMTYENNKHVDKEFRKRFLFEYNTVIAFKIILTILVLLIVGTGFFILWGGLGIFIFIAILCFGWMCSV